MNNFIIVLTIWTHFLPYHYHKPFIIVIGTWSTIKMNYLDKQCKSNTILEYRAHSDSQSITISSYVLMREEICECRGKKERQNKIIFFTFHFIIF